MSENDLIKLYSGQILALAADIPHTAALAAPDAQIKARAPLCGSTVTVEICMENDRITEFSQDVKACALGQAAAAIVGQHVIGADRAMITRADAQLTALLQENGPTPDAPFEGLEILRAAHTFKNRHASIGLTLNALVQAMAQIANTR